MQNKKGKLDQQISTKLGTIVLIVIALTVGVFVWKVEKDQEIAEQSQNVVSVKKPTAPQPAPNNINNGVPAEPICDNESNLVHWNGSKNGYYYAENTDYFSFSYPCDYKITFSDMGGIYRLNNKNDKNKIISISGNLLTKDATENKLANIKKLYPSAQTAILNDTLNINYPYKIFSIRVDKDAQQTCGECLIYPGHTDIGVDIQVNNKYIYSFQADSSVDKNELFNIVESFVYHVIK